ncbi:hypothetical protein F5Y13DRAFT_186535 [Hypoxylon sp. FL1857]|nr:hypothetical protein F5Y13DRAFT_186535 [Hypoxylon sp. FL1857]
MREFRGRRLRRRTHIVTIGLYSFWDALVILVAGLLWSTGVSVLRVLAIFLCLLIFFSWIFWISSRRRHSIIYLPQPAGGRVTGGVTGRVTGREGGRDGRDMGCEVPREICPSKREVCCPRKREMCCERERVMECAGEREMAGARGREMGREGVREMARERDGDRERTLQSVERSVPGENVPSTTTMALTGALAGALAGSLWMTGNTFLQASAVAIGLGALARFRRWYNSENQPEVQYYPEREAESEDELPGQTEVQYYSEEEVEEELPPMPLRVQYFPERKAEKETELPNRLRVQNYLEREVEKEAELPGQKFNIMRNKLKKKLNDQVGKHNIKVSKPNIRASKHNIRASKSKIMVSKHTIKVGKHNTRVSKSNIKVIKHNIKVWKQNTNGPNFKIGKPDIRVKPKKVEPAKLKLFQAMLL